jgi:hypothetical protein
MTLRHGEEDPAPRVEGNPQGGLLPGSMGEAAPGLQGRESLTTGDKKTLSVEGTGVRYFCDVHRRARNGEGYRITFTTDGVTFKHVDSFAEIPVKAGDKVFVDVIPLNHTDDAIGLLRHGVELYCLRRLTLIEKKRGELKLPKTTRGDIKVLMSIEERWFRKISEDFLAMRRLISIYRTMLKTHQQYLNRYKAFSEKERSGLKPVINVLEKQMNIMAKKIAEEAGRRYPTYNKLVEELGIADNTTAMEALAELMAYVDFSSWTRVRNYLGMWKRDRKTRYHRSKTARRALERLAMTIKGYGVKGRDLEEVLKTIWTTLRTQKTGPPA